MMPSVADLEQEEEVEAEAFANPQSEQPQASDEPAAPESEPQPTQQASAGDGDDDSIEAYMNRLLGRVQGSPESGEESPAESVSLSSASLSLDADSDPSTTDSAAAMTPSVEIDPNAPLVPRSHAPERNSDLSAMRELANQSARTAN